MEAHAFRFVGTVQGQFEPEGDLYEAMFQLPDDGCPDSEQFLRVQVIADKGEYEIRLHVVSKHSETLVLSAETNQIEGVGRLLYGAARIVTTREIVPK